MKALVNTCLGSADFIGGDKYYCRLHDSDMYIEKEFWETETDTVPECEARQEQTS